VWEEFWKAMEKDFWFASTKFWQTVLGTQEGKAGLGSACAQSKRITADPD